MSVDARGLADGRVIDTDVCIVGGGPAGIALALELAGSGPRVCLLESGGYEYDAATQDLYAGAVVGRPYFPLEAARLRYFGGTSNHWSGLCHPLDPIDFERRDWVPHSGWPIARSELDSHYERARAYCELGPDPPVLGQRRPANAPDVMQLGAERVRTTLMGFSPPTRFGRVYRDAVEAAPNVRTYLHANAVEIELDRDADRVRGIRCRTLAGSGFRVVARAYVIAAGGLETPRLLLASRSVRPAGVGNEHDLVGRYFMEHPHLPAAARWLLVDGGLHRPLYDWPDTDEAGRYERQEMGLLVFPAEVARRERLLGFSAELQISSEAQDTEAFRSLRALVRGGRRGRVPEDFGDHVGNVLSDLGSAARGTYEKATGTLGRARILMRTRAEQSPDPESRVTLGDERDALDMPRLRLAWRLSELDFASLRRGLEVLALEVGRAGLGRMQLPEDESWRENVAGGWHHMGTTRMSEQPARGVVDRDCRIHSLGNLYIAGSSVFTTAGWANPTLTLVALAVRLADHLKRSLG